MIRSGKYKGQVFREVEHRDPRYCGWLMEAASLPRDLKKFAAYLRQNRGGLLNVGKHKGEYFSDVWEKDQEYGIWALELKQPGGALKDFVEYSKKKRKAEEEASPTEKKDDNKEWTKPCIICAEGNAECLFVPCGHMTTCQMCSNAVVSKPPAKCPICRKAIAISVRAYL